MVTTKFIRERLEFNEALTLLATVLPKIGSDDE